MKFAMRIRLKPTPYETKNKFDSRVSLMLPVETDGNCALSDHDGADMVTNRNRRQLSTEEKFEDVHGDKNLVDNDEDCCLSSH